jgi:hypothetical protein
MSPKNREPLQSRYGEAELTFGARRGSYFRRFQFDFQRCRILEHNLSTGDSLALIVDKRALEYASRQSVSRGLQARAFATIVEEGRQFDLDDRPIFQRRRLGPMLRLR